MIHLRKSGQPGRNLRSPCRSRPWHCAPDDHLTGSRDRKYDLSTSQGFQGEKYLLALAEQGDFLLTDTADRHTRALSALEIVYVPAQGFPDQIGPGTVLDLSDEVNLLEKSRG